MPKKKNNVGYVFDNFTGLLKVGSSVIEIKPDEVVLYGQVCSEVDSGNGTDPVTIFLTFSMAYMMHTEIISNMFKVYNLLSFLRKRCKSVNKQLINFTEMLFKIFNQIAFTYNSSMKLTTIYLKLTLFEFENMAKNCVYFPGYESSVCAVGYTRTHDYIRFYKGENKLRDLIATHNTNAIKFCEKYPNIPRGSLYAYLNPLEARCIIRRSRRWGLYRNIRDDHGVNYGITALIEANRLHPIFDSPGCISTTLDKLARKDITLIKNEYGNNFEYDLFSIHLIPVEHNEKLLMKTIPNVKTDFGKVTIKKAIDIIRGMKLLVLITASRRLRKRTLPTELWGWLYDEFIAHQIT